MNRRLASAFLLFALQSGSALAADLTPPPQTDANGWIVTVSAAGIVAPSFPGAQRMRLYPFPSISFRRVGEPELFSTPDEGFGLPIYDDGVLRFGPVANFVFPRGQRDGLFGLRRIGLSHEIGGYAEYYPMNHFRLRAEMRQAIDGHRGFVAALYADAYDRLGPFRVSLGPRLNIGDNRYANAFYSVTPFEALVNGRLSPYTATGGFTAAGGVATIRYDFNEATSATIFGGGQRLLGSVGDSPIPQLIGSRDQWTAGFAIARSFVVADPISGATPLDFLRPQK